MAEDFLIDVFRMPQVEQPICCCTETVLLSLQDSRGVPFRQMATGLKRGIE
jgi:hypothetical protein